MSEMKRNEAETELKDSSLVAVLIAINGAMHATMSQTTLMA